MADFVKFRGLGHFLEYSTPWLWCLVAFYMILPVLAYFIIPHFVSTRSKGSKTVCIIVMGDLGHSPRMCYHAVSFSKHGYSVFLCGYLESQPPEEIVDDANIEIYPINPIKNTGQISFVLFAVKKVIIQICQLLRLLFQFKGSELVMIQNPPCIPLLAVTLLQVRLFSTNTKIAIDWHNLNYSILRLKYHNKENFLVKFLKLYEKYLGRFADFHITVTEKMKHFLVNEFHFLETKIIPFHDRPGPQFVPRADLDITKNEFIKRLDLYSDIPSIEDYCIVVTATSFTPDENLDILLNALLEYDKKVSLENLPPLLIIITGKGPLKQEFLRRVTSTKFLSSIIIRSDWLSMEDYAKVLAFADLGISLHTSSSGLDLPMKILDYFGCGLPVITLNFPAISELVKDGENGLVTNPSRHLVEQDKEICRLLVQVFSQNSVLERIMKGALAESMFRWDQNWNENLAPYLC